MKRSVLLVLLLALAVPCLAFGQTLPPKPGPEHKKWEMYVGDWTYEGEDYATPFGAASKYSGKVSIRMILEGFFLEWRGEEHGAAGSLEWLEIDAYEAVAKHYVFYNFDNTGGNQTVTYTIDGRKVYYSGTLLRGGQQAITRGTAVFAEDLKTFVVRAEVSIDGTSWMPFWEDRLTKVR